MNDSVFQIVFGVETVPGSPLARRPTLSGANVSVPDSSSGVVDSGSLSRRARGLRSDKESVFTMVDDVLAATALPLARRAPVSRSFPRGIVELR